MITGQRTEQKRVSISSKRQFTIPQKFYTQLGFEKDAVCMVEDGKLIIIPAGHLSGGEFAEQILAELIEDGFSGKELLNEFRIRQAGVRPAVEKMLDAAKAAARGEAESFSYDDVSLP